MNIDKQATADILALVVEAIIAIFGFVLKLLFMTFRSVFKSSKAHSSKSQKSATRPSSENKVERIARDHERLESQKYERDTESNERDLEHGHQLLEEAMKHGEVESFEYKNGKYSVRYKKGRS
jgi:hypothetical protein